MKKDPATIESKNIIEVLRSKSRDHSPNNRELSSHNDEDLIINDNLIMSALATAIRDYGDEVVDLPMATQNGRTTSTDKANRMKNPDLSADHLKFSAKTSAYAAKGNYPQPQNDQGILRNHQIFSPNSLLSGKKVYNSYQQFNPGQFHENSPAWQMAMLRYLIDMKDHGHKIHEVSVNKVRFKKLFMIYYAIYYHIKR